MKTFSIVGSIALAISTVFSSCNKNNIEDSTLSSISIQNAKALFISSSDAGGSKLYGIQSTPLKSGDEDEIFEIKYFNSEGEEITKSNPSNIYNLKNYVVLMFQLEYSFYETFLVRKSDGKTFLLPTNYMAIPAGSSQPFLNAYAFQEDENNNLYFLRQKNGAFDRSICKVSLNNPSSLQIQEISAVNDYVTVFCVDKHGNMLYSRSYEEPLRYRYASGDFANYKNLDEVIWVGTDGKMYAIQNDFLGTIQNNVFMAIKKVNMRPNSEIFNVQKKIIYVQQGMLCNISNEAEYVEISCAIQPNVVIKNELYNFDKNTLKLTKIDVSTAKTETVYDLDETRVGNYDIDNIISVSETGITFSATDLTNGNYVVAKISTNNSVEVQTTITGIVATIVSLN